MIRKAILQINSPNRFISILSLLSSLLSMGVFITYIVSEVQTGNLAQKSLSGIGGQALVFGIILLPFVLVRSIFRGLEDAFYHEEQIICGIGVADTPYSWQHLLDEKCKEIILVGQSLKTLFAQKEFRERIVTLMESSQPPRIKIIMTVPEIMLAIHGDQVGYHGFIETVRDLRNIYYDKLVKSKREMLSVHFHPGASSLSAIIRDPDDTKRGILVFTPKWATDRESQNRMFCVLEKWRHQILFKKLYGHVSDMTRSESGSLQEMCRKLEVGLPAEDSG